MKDNKELLNDAEKLSIRRLKAKGVPIRDIADRIGLNVPEIVKFLKTGTL